MGLKDLLTVADLQGYAPPEMVLVGVQPASIEMDMELSPAVEQVMPALKEMILRELKGWGISPEM
jgi:hydrogenase maturation protease